MVPQISMPNQQNKTRNIYENDNNDLEDTNNTTMKNKKESPIKQQQVQVKKEKAATAGWFGGIWNKLALRPKNQMKLPDDKNPTVNFFGLVFLLDICNFLFCFRLYGMQRRSVGLI